MKTHTFPKAEHLCRRSDISRLFQAGSRAATAYPLRAVFRRVPPVGGEPPVKVLLSVGKRHFHHAVDRNRAKRQLREAYRHHKQVILDALPADEALSLGLIWLADTPQPTALVTDRLERLLHLIADRLAPRPDTVSAETAAGSGNDRADGEEGSTGGGKNAVNPDAHTVAMPAP